LPLQKLLGEQTVTTVHYVCATVFILSLGIITFCFGVREGRRSQQRDGHRASRSPTFWRRFHWSCAGAQLPPRVARPYLDLESAVKSPYRPRAYRSV
jgi:hypothetical protein